MATTRQPFLALVGGVELARLRQNRYLIIIEVAEPCPWSGSPCGGESGALADVEPSAE